MILQQLLFGAYRNYLFCTIGKGCTHRRSGSQNISNNCHMFRLGGGIFVGRECNKNSRHCNRLVTKIRAIVLPLSDTFIIKKKVVKRVEDNLQCPRLTLTTFPIILSFIERHFNGNGFYLLIANYDIDFGTALCKFFLQPSSSYGFAYRRALSS